MLREAASRSVEGAMGVYRNPVWFAAVVSHQLMHRPPPAEPPPHLFLRR
jgi:hypothetical protein